MELKENYMKEQLKSLQNKPTEPSCVLIEICQ